MQKAHFRTFPYAKVPESVNNRVNAGTGCQVPAPQSAISRPLGVLSLVLARIAQPLKLAALALGWSAGARVPLRHRPAEGLLARKGARPWGPGPWRGPRPWEGPRPWSAIWGQILIKCPCCLWSAAALGKARDLHDPHVSVESDRDDIPHAYPAAGRLDALTIHADVARGRKPGRRAAGPHHPGVP